MAEHGIRERLIGCWRLAGYGVTAADWGETERPLGNNPLGTILCTPDGYMSAQLERPAPDEHVIGAGPAGAVPRTGYTRIVHL